MNAIMNAQNLMTQFVTTLWTPIFVGIFLAITAYALWPLNKKAFDEAARLPLREE